MKGTRRRPHDADSVQSLIHKIVKGPPRSDRAITVNIEIMRAFVRLRELIATHKSLARKLDELEKKYDHHFQVVFEAIRQLMESPAPEKPQIGFKR